jgi:hypothetical protein
MRRLRSICGLGLMGWLALGALPLTAEETVIRPGGLVVWEGQGIGRCVLGKRGWGPLADACWYPVDLLRVPGPLELRRWRQGQWEKTVIRVTDYPYAVQEIHIADESRVHLSAEDLKRVERERKRVGEVLRRSTPLRFELPLYSPLPELPQGGRFGAKRVINGEPRSPHTGADYTAPAGTPVLAVADGEVALAEEHFFAGNAVFVDHGDGLISMYFHLSEIGVEVGQRVQRGDRLGAVGATGRATGPHLHFAVRWHGARVDPQLLLGPLSDLPRIAR